VRQEIAPPLDAEDDPPLDEDDEDEPVLELRPDDDVAEAGVTVCDGAVEADDAAGGVVEAPPVAGGAAKAAALSAKSAAPAATTKRTDMENPPQMNAAPHAQQWRLMRPSPPRPMTGVLQICEFRQAARALVRAARQ